MATAARRATSVPAQVTASGEAARPRLAWSAVWTHQLAAKTHAAPFNEVTEVTRPMGVPSRPID